MVRYILTALLISVVFVLALGVRLSWLASGHLADAQAAVGQKQYALAFEGYNRAIRNYYPANPYAKQAIKLAVAYIEDHSQKVNQDLQQLRGTLLSIRSLYQPYSSEFEWIEAKMSENE